MLNNHSNLVLLHDAIMAHLDSREKRGIRQLLTKNNRSFKTLILPHIKASGAKEIGPLLAALDYVLEVHAKECYTIGYLDCMTGKMKKH